MKRGALVLGSDYRGLGAVQSLGRHGVEVWVVHDPGWGVAPFSRYAHRSIRWPEGPESDRVAFLLDLAERRGLEGWALFPTRDDTVTLCARNEHALAGAFRLTTPSWEAVRHARDKKLTYRLAAELGVPFPATLDLGRDGMPGPDWPYPSIIKPSLKERTNKLTLEKAWPVNDRRECEDRFAEARRLMPAEEILLQELIPGRGATQVSFAALAVDGRAVSSLVASRTRQIPMDIGRASTFVETIDDPEVRSMAQAILDRLHYTGLVEIEFKRDPRDGEPKLLDINPRLWGWHTLGRRAGMDFTYLNWKLAYGECPPHLEAPSGVRWVWPAADIPTAVREVAGGRLRIGDYLRAFRAPVDFATLVIDDPLPGLMEIPMHGLESFRRWMRASRRPSPRTSGASNRLHQNGSAEHTSWIRRSRAAIRLGAPRAVRRNSDRGARP